jgi:2-keto-3-deoxy-L-fuconate dehydrogenase
MKPRSSPVRSEGRRALVTGAASGIGRAACLRLAEDGYRVAGLDRSALDGLPLAHRATVDVSDEDAAIAAVDAAADALGGIDVLVTAAGVTGRGTVADITLAEWQRIMAVNVTGVFLVARAALPYLRSSEAASIVLVASQLGLVGAPAAAAYCASKGAILSLGRAMALDHAADGITVNAVCPGPTDTPMTDFHLADEADPAAAKAGLIDLMPLGRLVDPAEVAGAIAYLADPQARATTGTMVVVDGGYITR